MKFSRFSLSALLAAALFAIVGSVGATSGKISADLQRSREQICGGAYENCMRGGGVLGPVIGKNDAGQRNQLPTNPNAEQDAASFKALLAKNEPSANLGGNTYCYKMLISCDNGNAGACRNFERYCQPNEG